MCVGIPVIPWSRGVTDGAGAARFHDRNTDQAEAEGSVAVAGVAALEGHLGSFVVIAMTAGSLPGSNASRPPGTRDQE
jgi:hypothetical protein